MSNNPVVVFSKEGYGTLRTIVIDGEKWFVGRDVAIALGYAKPQNALSNHVDDDDALKWGIVDSNGKTQQTTLINESGLYSLILSSKLEKAKEFKRWVTKEVLPSINKTGKFEMNVTVSTRKLSAANTTSKILMKALSDAGVSDKLKIETLREVYSKAGIDIPVEPLQVEMNKKATKLDRMNINYHELEELYRGKSHKCINDDMADILSKDVSDNVKKVMIEMMTNIKYGREQRFN